MPVLRLDKIVSDSKVGSRRRSTTLIRQGLVTVNGKVVTASDAKFDTDTDIIRLRGEELRYTKFCYLMLNKPAGYVSAVEDKRERSVLELVPVNYKKRGLFPVGRLDKDTEGLMLLTNDGDYAHNIISPKKHIGKVYYAELSAAITESDINAFSGGVKLKDGTVCMPALLESIDETCQKVLITVYEGKYHQVKRMISVLGNSVEYLKRVRIGMLELDPGLELGECTELDELSRSKALL